MEKFRFGILGCGLISTVHANAITQIDRAVITGAYDLNESARNAFCERFDVAGFKSKEAFLSSDKIDAVCICLPSGLHFEAAMECINYKKHVVIEKPIALTPSQAEKIIKAAEENHVFVSVISQLRYTKALKEIKRIADSGKLGTITLGNAIMKYWRDPAYYANNAWRGTQAMDGGGALMNQGIHGIDLLQYIMGRVVAVSAFAKTLVHDIETEDTLTAVLEYENGALGTIQATTSVAPGYARRIEICGSGGTIVLCEDSIEICDVEGEEHLVTGESKNYASASRPDGIDSSLHAEQLNDFIKSVLSNKKPWIDACEGKKSIDIVCAIYESAKTGKKVFLK